MLVKDLQQFLGTFTDKLMKRETEASFPRTPKNFTLNDGNSIYGLFAFLEAKCRFEAFMAHSVQPRVKSRRAHGSRELDDRARVGPLKGDLVDAREQWELLDDALGLEDRHDVLRSERPLQLLPIPAQTVGLLLCALLVSC